MKQLKSSLENSLTRGALRQLLLVGICAGLIGSVALAQQAELLFTYWGSPQEKTAIESMVSSFNEQHPDINVRAQYIPNTTYVEKISAMLASGNPPDVAYLSEGQAFPWASEGTLLDLSSYFKEDAEASNRLPATYYNYGDGKTLGTNTAGETMILYYNKALFEDAGVDLPPSEAADAWTWDEFVEAAKKLTKDRNGNDATSPDFDPKAIQTYGISFPQWWGGYLPFVYSNGGDLANEAGTELLLNQPAAVEVLQKMQDLIYVHHVAPTPAQSQTFPSADVMMQTGKVAMTIDGQWKVLDFSQLGMDWGMGVLPKFKKPVTVMLGAPTVIFAATKYPDAAFEFYKFHNNPEYVDLFEKGLWMPLQESYYKDPKKTAEWLDGQEGVYPPEARDVLVDYTLNGTPKQPPAYWLKNFGQIESDALTPALEQLWNGSLTAQAAMDQAAAKAKPLLEGRW